MKAIRIIVLQICLFAAVLPIYGQVFVCNYQPYTPTTTFSTFYSAPPLQDMAYINDGDIATNGTIWGAGAPIPFEMAMDFSSAVQLDSVKIRGGQFNGNFNIPVQMDLYRGTSAGTLLITIIPTYTFDTYSFVNTESSTLYTWVIVPSASTYASLREIECYANVLAVSDATTNVSCNGGNNGAIDITVSGGTGLYTYLWSTTATTQDISGLSAGSYNVTVTDSCGSQAVDTVVISEPLPLTLTLSLTAEADSCDGSVSVIPAGGTPTYTYLWDAAAGSQTTSLADSLCEGTFCVTVTDDNGCTADTCVTITSTSGINTVANESTQALIYPNPNDGIFRIDLDKAFGKEIVILMIDVSGKLVMERSIEKNTETLSVELNTENQAKGMYYLKVISDGRLSTFKIIIE
ncbi:T9SS type A sorting domain-containing protein [Crocinitomix catalasitica]|nr:T9SS type A sorting domain-containing protein [Crocinitomix catalasitica]